MRGLAADWPMAQASDKAAYLKRFDSGAKTEMSVAAPEHKGRLFYTGDFAELNFTKQPATVSAVLDRIVAAAGESEPETIAAQAVTVGEALPGFAAENRLQLFDQPVEPRIWIGNRVVTATHHDMVSNVAVVVAGRRRFTLFPPEQVASLYIGPFEFTPAGTPASLVDPEAPDLDRFPLAAEALKHARTAELEPGDAIYIPHMWWHHVRSLDELSILVGGRRAGAAAGPRADQLFDPRFAVVRGFAPAPARSLAGDVRPFRVPRRRRPQRTHSRGQARDPGQAQRRIESADAPNAGADAGPLKRTGYRPCGLARGFVGCAACGAEGPRLWTICTLSWIAFTHAVI